MEWAYGNRSISSISRFLGVSRGTVRAALLEHGIAQPQTNPFPGGMVTDGSGSPSVLQPAPEDNILDPILPMLATEDLRAQILQQMPIQTTELQENRRIISYTGPLSSITDEELDSLILQLRQNFVRAGITMLHGMLRRLGYRIPRSRIQQSLYRIDPVQRIFSRIRIRRRTYNVAGPNALWHHDGQHG